VNIPFDSEVIRKNGWRQGSVCSDLARSVICKIPDALAILLSHNCDIVQKRLDKEPNVEILIAVPIDQSDGNCIKGKNSRCYHFSLNDLFYEIKATERISVPRHFLVKNEPHSSQLSMEEVNAIVHWFAQRYERPAFPDNFNKRLSDATKKVIKNALEESGNLVSGIYISCPQNELPDNKPYQILFYVVMSVEDYGDIEKLGKCEDISEAILESMNTKSHGIVVENSDNMCISEKEISLHDLRFLKRFTLFDHFSFDSGIEPSVS